MSNENHCRLNNSTPHLDQADCAACDDLLDVYLDAELTDVDVRARYPAIWHHLQQCERCGPPYRALRSIRQRPDASFATTAIPFDLPFLQHKQATQIEQKPWTMHLGSALTGEPWRLHFSFSPTYLQKCLTASSFPHPATSTGVAADNSPTRLLLLEPIRLAEQPIVAKLTALLLPAQKTFVRLQANLNNARLLADEIQVTLHWGEVNHTAPLPQMEGVELGLAPLSALEPANLKTSPHFSLTFTPKIVR